MSRCAPWPKSPHLPGVPLSSPPVSNDLATTPWQRPSFSSRSTTLVSNRTSLRRARWFPAWRSPRQARRLVPMWGWASTKMLGSAPWDKPFEGLADVAALLASRVQACRRCRCLPPFAKAVIGFGVDEVFSVEFGQIAATRAHVFASLKNNRTHPCLKHSSGVQPAGPGPHNQHRRGVRGPSGQVQGCPGPLALLHPTPPQLCPDGTLCVRPNFCATCEVLVLCQGRTSLLPKLPRHSLTDRPRVRVTSSGNTRTWICEEDASMC